MADVTIRVQPTEKPKLSLSTVSAVKDKLKSVQLDPAYIQAVVDTITHPETHPDEAGQAVIDKLKDLKVDPAQIALVIEKLKQVFPNAKGFAIDPVTAATVVTTGWGIISKLNIGDTAKSLILKLAIFLFGIFCGIGIVYKSGLPLPSDNPTVTPPSNVAVYQKRIEELQTENAQLRKLLEPQPQPEPDGPPVWPLPKTDPQPKVNPVPPSVTPHGVRQGVIIQLK